MGLFSVFEKIINIENINLGCKKTREEDYIKKLNAIFAYVVECIITNKEIIIKNIPKEIIDFIHQDILNSSNILNNEMKIEIQKERQNFFNEKDKEMRANMHLMNSAQSFVQFEQDCEEKFLYVKNNIQAKYENKRQQLFDNILKDYNNGNRLNNISFTKLRSFFKNNEEIDSIYSDISKSNKIL